MTKDYLPVCNRCGSKRIQELMLAWCDVNGDRVEVDYSSEPGVFYSVSTWCKSCDGPTEFDWVDRTEYAATRRRLRSKIRKEWADAHKQENAPF